MNDCVIAARTGRTTGLPTVPLDTLLSDAMVFYACMGAILAPPCASANWAAEETTTRACRAGLTRTDTNHTNSAAPVSTTSPWVTSHAIRRAASTDVPT